MSKIIVGYHGSEESEQALRWATTAALRTGRALVIATSVTGPSAYGDPMGFPFLAPDLTPSFEKIAARAAEQASAAGVTDVSVVVDARQADQQLVELSREADLVVLGTRGRSELICALLGSVSYAVCAHAACPVVVVKGDGAVRLGPGHPAVVGVDGSRASLNAAEFAAQAAAAMGASVVCVVAWSMPVVDPGVMAVIPAPEFGAAREGQQARAREVGDTVLARLKNQYPDLPVEVTVVEGLPSQSLLGAVPDPGLVVTGSRGHGGFAGLLLGSVSHRLLHDAECPVMVTR